MERTNPIDKSIDLNFDVISILFGFSRFLSLRVVVNRAKKKMIFWVTNGFEAGDS